ncbi:extracellular solute-binding protein [Brucella sp. IR073]|uniref:extracellular solute-binding protein n=1 Tax=unclassified Brucella TaxID=2632610 RepID=UPI003B97DA8C
MRVMLAGAIALALVAGFSSYGNAQDSEPKWRHASSLVGEPKYPAGFKQYDYVNPNAPKGGTLNSVAVGTFDSLNPFVIQGVPAAGFSPLLGGLLYDSLMARSADQDSVSYALVAEAMQYPDDFSWAKFRLNPAARWHDGKPITVEDVIWSFETVKKNTPIYNKYYADVVKAEKTGDHEVKFTFSQKGNRELPAVMGDLPVLPKHWWEGTDASGKKRDISRPTLEIPLGSGAYKVEKVDPGRSIVWARVPDYWGKDLPIHVGRNNFDHIRYDYFMDANAAWEAFKKGGLDDYRPENRIQRWMQEYNFPAVERGDVIKRAFPIHSMGRMQAYFLNTRREKFSDRRVREGLNWVFDFQSINRTLFFNQYKRVESYFEGIDLASSGLPTGKELEILETVRDQVPPEVFTKEFKEPVFDTPQATRTNLRHAMQLFQDAGYTLKDGVLTDKNGNPFTIEFLGNDPTDERIFNPFVENLRRVGIRATVRIVDSAQYEARVRDFDYDVIATIIGQTNSPGNEQREYWGSAAADIKGGRNYSGIRNPAVDKLIDRVIYAKDRDELVAAVRALDRVLLWNYYVVPQWYDDKIHVAIWNKFGMPEKQPDYSGIDPFSWWIDPAKQKALLARGE